MSEPSPTVTADTPKETAAVKSARRRARATSRRAVYDRIRRGILRDPRNYAVVEVLDQRVEAVWDGPGVTRTGGKLDVVGKFLVSFNGLLESLGSRTTMNNLAFGSSVRIELRPFVSRETRQRAARLAERDPEGLVDDELLKELIPDSVVAVTAAAELLATPAQDGLREARRHGRAVADAYVRMARTVAEGQATLRVSAPGREAAMGSRRAQLVIDHLEERTELEPYLLTVAGRLTRTDSEEETFRIVLDRERMPPQLDGRRRVIEGSYTTGASRQVQEGGLWDRDVIARVRVYPVRDPLHPKPVMGRFRFINVLAET
jgi:hypothetical protein